jgi:hypothetical protein
VPERLRRATQLGSELRNRLAATPEQRDRLTTELADTGRASTSSSRRALTAGIHESGGLHPSSARERA